MRFTVDKEYVFITFEVQPCSDFPGASFYYTNYIPWHVSFKKIHLVKLKCVEHRKVRDTNSGSDELSCDGFLFKDEEGKEWYNHWFGASYGQLSTASDNYVMTTREGKRPIVLERVDSRLITILDGVQYFNDKANIDNVEEYRNNAKSLQVLYDLIVKEIKDLYDITVCAYPKILVDDFIVQGIGFHKPQ